MSVQIGQIIESRYRLVRLLGRGGMGSVYEGEHTKLAGQRVAIKVLDADAAGQADLVQRFEQEGRLAASIQNDHIIDVRDVGTLPDGAHYLVYEYLDGETLSDRLKRTGRLTPDQIVPIVRQVLDGLGAAHDLGIVHRDLKPDNIFLLRHKAGWKDFVKIIDFGVSKSQPTEESNLAMTATGAVLGTPYYLSPEQSRDTSSVDPRSDLYTVGVILYEAVTGQLPHNAANVTDLLFKIVLERPKAPNEVHADIDAAFSDLILKAMAREPEARFQSAVEFAAALEPWMPESNASAPVSTLPVSTVDARDSASPASIASTSDYTAHSFTPRTWQRTPEATESARGRKTRTVALVGALVAATGVASYFAFSGSAEENTQASHPPAPSEPAMVGQGLDQSPTELTEQKAPQQVSPTPSDPAQEASRSDPPSPETEALNGVEQSPPQAKAPGAAPTPVPSQQKSDSRPKLVAPKTNAPAPKADSPAQAPSPQAESRKRRRALGY